MRHAAAALAVLGSLLAPAVASAGTPAAWSRVTPTSTSVEHPGLARDDGGVLHVTYGVERSITENDLWQRPIALDGSAGTAVELVHGLYSLGGSPTLLPGSAGALVATFGAQASGAADDSGTYQAIGPFPATPARIHTTDGDFAYSPDWADAIRLADGRYAYVHTATLQLNVQVEGAANVNHADPTGCCQYAARLAVEGSTGNLWLGWYGNGSGGRDGVMAMRLDPTTGAAVGTAQRMVGTKGSIAQTDSWVAITGRPARSGIWVAYLTGVGSGKQLWIVRQGATRRLVTGAPADGELLRVALAPDTRGRIWVVWAARMADGTTRVFARRSNPKVNELGARVSLAKLPTGRVVTTLRADAVRADGVVDVVTRLVGAASAAATWHAQAVAGLSLTAAPATYPAASGGTITFHVRDAGVPVAGAVVHFRGKTATTGAGGAAKITVGPSARKRFEATATKAGYRLGAIKVRAA